MYRAFSNSSMRNLMPIETMRIFQAGLVISDKAALRMSPQGQTDWSSSRRGTVFPASVGGRTNERVGP